jgi:hypothetical protein
MMTGIWSRILLSFLWFVASPLIAIWIANTLLALVIPYSLTAWLGVILLQFVLLCPLAKKLVKLEDRFKNANL